MGSRPGRASTRGGPGAGRPLSCIRALGTQMPAFALGRIVLITGTPSWEPCSSIWAPAAFCGLGHPDTPSEAGFLNLSTVDFGGWIILGGKAHPVHFRRYSTIPTFYPLDASFPTALNVSGLDKLSPLRSTGLRGGLGCGGALGLAVAGLVGL